MEAGLVATAVGGDTSVLLRGVLGLSLGRGIRVWGEGRSPIRTGAAGENGSAELSFGYGGVGAEWTREGGRLEPSVGLLAGGGHGRVSSRFTGVELGSENVLVVEPSVALRSLPHRALSVGIGGGYRWSSSVERLAGIRPGGLRGWTLSISARLMQNP